MSNANPQAPKVFVVPELMPSEPIEVGGLLEEHLKAERLREAASVRERIEAYLKDSGVLRKPAGEAWPNASQLASMSAVERQRWATLGGPTVGRFELEEALRGQGPARGFQARYEEAAAGDERRARSKHVRRGFAAHRALRLRSGRGSGARCGRVRRQCSCGGAGHGVMELGGPGEEGAAPLCAGVGAEASGGWEAAVAFYPEPAKALFALNGRGGGQ